MRGRISGGCAAFLVALAAAAPAAAGPTIPKALDGVALKGGGSATPDEDGTFAAYTLVAVTVDKAPVELDGRRVIVFRQRYRYHTGTHHGEVKGEAVDLGVVDATTREYLANVRIDDRYRSEWYLHGKDRGALAYKVAWKDRNRDGTPELLLARSRATGAAKGAPRRKVMQLRGGRFQEVSPALAACPVGGGEPEAAIAALVAAVEAGGDAGCAYLEAMHAAAADPALAPAPAKGATMVLAPVAEDCPARSWAEGRGRRFEPARTLAFLTADGELAIATARRERIDAVLAALDDVEHGLGDAARGSEDVERIDARVVDRHLYLLVTVRFRAGKKTSRHAVVYDPVRLAIVAQGRLRGRARARFVEDRAANRLEVPGVWSTEVLAW